MEILIGIIIGIVVERLVRGRQRRVTPWGQGPGDWHPMKKRS